MAAWTDRVIGVTEEKRGREKMIEVIEEVIGKVIGKVIREVIAKVVGSKEKAWPWQCAPL
uniref:hypothetical protein n=1 Tax=Comamonas terrigena TaxID=32013 RepID=UPI000833F4CE|nr:hypothetical protein [Comamonas terrigena]